MKRIAFLVAALVALPACGSDELQPDDMDMGAEEPADDDEGDSADEEPADDDDEESGGNSGTEQPETFEEQAAICSSQSSNPGLACRVMSGCLEGWCWALPQVDPFDPECMDAMLEGPMDCYCDSQDAQCVERCDEAKGLAVAAYECFAADPSDIPSREECESRVEECNQFNPDAD